MRRLAMIASLSLGACSPVGQTAPTEAANDTATGGATPRSVPAGQGLHGEISPLSGTISDFKVTVSDTQTIVELPADILFAFDSADLTAAAQGPLKRTADLVAKGGAGDIRIVGHTDAKGEEAYNVELSQRRARSVGSWLSSNGVAASRLKSEGRGEADPVAPNTGSGGAADPKGRALNRRVVIYIPR